MDFGWPNAENGWKMANGQLLFLALDILYTMYIILIFMIYNSVYYTQILNVILQYVPIALPVTMIVDDGPVPALLTAATLML